MPTTIDLVGSSLAERIHREGLFLARGSTIEVHPFFSAASHLGGLSRKKVFQAKIKLHPDDESHGPSIQTHHFSKQDWHSDGFRL